MTDEEEHKRMKAHWCLDPDFIFLNHGSFGACPKAVLDRQSEYRWQLESQPLRFFERELPALHETARNQIAQFVGAHVQDIAFVPNATHGVNTVLRSLSLGPSDEILVTEFAYAACRNAVDFVAMRSGAQVRVAKTPFPGVSSADLKESIMAALSDKTTFALLDFITSPTGLIFPLEEIVPELEGRGVQCLVDGAHAPGMIALELENLGASYFVGNLHKWVCAPKGAAILHVRRDRQHGVRPLVISHGATVVDTGRTRFECEFEWQGTDDPTAYLAAPAALEFMGALMPGGWPELMKANRAMALKGRTTLCEALELPEPASEDVIGSLAAISLPHRVMGCENSIEGAQRLHDSLYFEDGIEVPVIYWPGQPSLILRVSAQAYNAESDYDCLAAALKSRSLR